MSSFNIKPTKKFTINKIDNKHAMLVGKLFSASAQLHIFHLQVVPPNSFAIHMALGGLYSAIPDKIDALVETIQGKTESIITNYTIDPMDNYTNVENVINYLKALTKILEEYRVSLLPSWANIDNQIQTIIDATESCIYKLKFL